jgi:septum formation protein
MLILASRSPRRQEILRNAGLRFRVVTPEVEEIPGVGEGAEAYVRRLAVEKARAVPAGAGETVLAADTVVVAGGTEILEKPRDAADAARMLRRLAGGPHAVLTGICLRTGRDEVVDVARTTVWFEELGEGEIAEYAASGEPLDKAGGYAIQGLASKFVSRIEGCYFNVVGLPVSLVYRHLRERGWG